MHRHHHRKSNSKTHPCPIFSYRVYFFLGSPILTMVPEKDRMERNAVLGDELEKQK